MKISAIALLTSLSLLLAAAGAHGTVVERIVATVGERAILLSDLKRRAEPFLVQVQQSVPAGAQRNAAISQVYKAVLQKIVDEELLEKAAVQAKINVSAAEVDEALKRVASQNQISVDQVLLEAERAGLQESKYREELRRQLLEAKLLNLRLQGRIRITEQDLKLAYSRLEAEERGQLAVQLAWIVVRGGKHGGQAQRIAEQVAERARREDFATVARQLSDDDATRENGGALARSRPDALPPAIARQALTLSAGQVSAPFRYGPDFIVLKVLDRDPSALPDYASARRELSERVYMDKMAQARRGWLDTLRRQHHVEVRL